METIDRLWQELESWLEEHRPDVFNDLTDGSSEKDLQRIAGMVSGELPAGLFASWRRHDGEDYDADFIFGRMRWLLPVEFALEQAQSCMASAKSSGTFEKTAEMRVFGPVRPFDWSAAWCPFLLDNDVLYCVDLNPGPGGTVGQVIIVDHEDLSLTRIAPSFESFFERAIHATRLAEPWPFKGQHTDWRK